MLLEGSGINLCGFIIDVPAPEGHNNNLHQEKWNTQRKALLIFCTTREVSGPCTWLRHGPQQLQDSGISLVILQGCLLYSNHLLSWAAAPAWQVFLPLQNTTLANGYGQNLLFTLFCMADMSCFSVWNCCLGGSGDFLVCPMCYPFIPSSL